MLASRYVFRYQQLQVCSSHVHVVSLTCSMAHLTTSGVGLAQLNRTASADHIEASTRQAAVISETA